MVLVCVPRNLWSYHEYFTKLETLAHISRSIKVVLGAETLKQRYVCMRNNAVDGLLQGTTLNTGALLNIEPLGTISCGGNAQECPGTSPSKF
jgi:hypothetical protein